MARQPLTPELVLCAMLVNAQTDMFICTIHDGGADATYGTPCAEDMQVIMAVQKWGNA